MSSENSIPLIGPDFITSIQVQPDWEAIPSKHRADIKKIVLGPSPGDDKSVPFPAEGLPDFAREFPNLTHLYLWKIDGLKELASLPSELKCLDLRGCDKLEEIKMLPQALETLDLGGCKSLTEVPLQSLAKLQRLYFDGCSSLDWADMKVFLKKQKVSPLLEMDASNTGFQELPPIATKTLRKLVLKSCKRLVSMKGIEQFSSLDHLNLSGCDGLLSLPGLAPQLRYLVLYGANKLSRFLDQDIGLYERGAKEGQNVLGRLKSHEKHGGNLSLSAHSKLLLLGNGRAGKSTLAKCLQWHSLDEAGKAKNPQLRPLVGQEKELSTHGLRFWNWSTQLEVPEESRQDLIARASVRKIPLTHADGSMVPGNIRIWDFGGQELYHNTHRIFAGEGTVFLIVWNAITDDEKLLQDCRGERDEVKKAEWLQHNRQRPLDYWLDYVHKVCEKPKVALVCTHTKKGGKHADWRSWLATKRYENMKLDCFYIDCSPDAQCLSNPHFQHLQRWIAENCGVMAETIGLLQPDVFSKAAKEVGAILEANEQSRKEGFSGSKKLIAYEDWCKILRSAHATLGMRPPLDSIDFETITGCLHEAGMIFEIGDGTSRHVLVDQAWAVDLIYQLIHSQSPLYHRFKHNHGWLAIEELDDDASWEMLKSDAQKSVLLRYMEMCKIVVQVENTRDGTRSGKLLFANERWLLPKLEEVNKRIDARVNLIREAGGRDYAREFAFEDKIVSEFDFRDLIAYMVKSFGTDAILMTDSFFVSSPGNDCDWCFRMKWNPKDKAGYHGNIEADLIARPVILEEMADRFEELFRSSECPSSVRGSVSGYHDAVLNVNFFAQTLMGEEQVGLSSRGRDQDFAAEILVQLKSAGYRTFHYSENVFPDSPNAEKSPRRTKEVIEQLLESPVIVLLLSDNYLENDPEKNVYCVWELAATINMWAERKRSMESILVVYAKGGELNSQGLAETLSKLFSVFSKHYKKKFNKLPADRKLAVTHYLQFQSIFFDAQANVRNFFNERGSPGWYSSIGQSKEGKRDFTKFLADVREAFGRRG